MSTRKKLKWGETPWDDWNRDDMLREIQRMYSAVLSARTALRLCAHGQEWSPFWGRGYGAGTGGKALDKCEQATKPYEENGEDIYRAFFRYADDLLFDGLGPQWRVCEQGHMFGSIHPTPPPTSCSMCQGAVRPIQWSDIK